MGFHWQEVKLLLANVIYFFVALYEKDILDSLGTFATFLSFLEWNKWPSGMSNQERRKRWSMESAASTLRQSLSGVYCRQDKQSVWDLQGPHLRLNNFVMLVQINKLQEIQKVHNWSCGKLFSYTKNILQY